MHTLTAMRFFVGVGLGGAPVSFSLFAEFVPTKQRGVTLVLIQGLFWAGGAMCEALLAWVVLGNCGSWNLLLVLSALPVGIICLFYPILPESPRFLVMTHQEEEAREVLKRVAKANGNQEAFPADFQLHMPAQGEQGAKVSELF